MRNIKKEKTKLIHMIEQAWMETDKGQKLHTLEQFAIVLAIYSTLLYLDIYDDIRGEHHKEYFVKRFLSLNNNMTQMQLAHTYGVCVDTMGDYCTMYISIFDKCLSSVKSSSMLSHFRKPHSAHTAGAKSEKTTDSARMIDDRILLTNLKEILL